MKCIRLEEWYDLHGEDLTLPEWETLMAHARSCPDCALYMRRRKEMLESLVDLPEPKIPADLHQGIMDFIDMSEAEEPPPSRLSDWFEPLLKPLEIGLSLACLYMVISLAGLDTPTKPRNKIRPLSPRIAHQGQRTTTTREPSAEGQMPPSEALVKVSDEEVALFLKRLQDYRQTHPAPSPAGTEREGIPQGRMVTFHE